MSNPFAQLGDYRDKAAVSEDLVSVNYLICLPDPNAIQNPQFSLLFRTLLKKDTRTKSRALSELDQVFHAVKKSQISSGNGGSTGGGGVATVDDDVHLAYIQMYAKLSIDVSPAVRLQSHKVLRSLYLLIGKKLTKYLQYSVGSWLVGTFDTDIQVSRAALESLNEIFPPPKRQVLIEKMKPAILEFLYTCLTSVTAKSLSDERYTSSQESTQKYTMLMRSCLEIFSNYPTLFVLEDEKVQNLVNSGRLWKFFSSSDRYLANSALKLAKMSLPQLNEDSEQIKMLWKELLRAGRKNCNGADVAFGVMQMMNLLTKKYPEITWPLDDIVRRDQLLSIGQFVNSPIPHSVNFWPYFYNLVMLIPEPPNCDLSVLYKFIERAVLNVRHNLELENSIWGCFISLVKQLTGRVSDELSGEFAIRVFKAAETSFKRTNAGGTTNSGSSATSSTAIATSTVGPHAALVKYLPTLLTKPGVHEFILKQIQQESTPFGYILVIAEMREFRTAIETHVLPKLSIHQLKQITAADPELTIPSNAEINGEIEWLDIASQSKKINAQTVAETFVAMHLEKHVLNHAVKLRSKVVLDLNQFCSENINDIDLIPSIITAHDIFVSKEISQLALLKLVEIALNDSDQIVVLTRVVKTHQQFVEQCLKTNAEFASKFEILASTTTNPLLQSLVKLGSQRNTKADGFGVLSIADSLDINDFDWSVPRECIVNDLRLTDFKVSSKGPELLLKVCTQMARDWLPLLKCKIALSTEQIVKICLVHHYFKCYQLVAPVEREYEGLTLAVQVSEFIVLTASEEALLELWRLCDKPGVGFLASLALAHSLPEDVEFNLQDFKQVSHKGALIANANSNSNSNSNKFKDLPEYKSLQSRLIRDALQHRLPDNEWMLIDRSMIPNDAVYTIDEKCTDPGQICRIVNTFGSRVRMLPKYVFESVDKTVEYSALKHLQLYHTHDESGDTNADSADPTYGSDDFEHELLEYASNLQIEVNSDLECARKCLELVNSQLDSNPKFGSDSMIIQELADHEGSLDLAWIAISVCKRNPDLKLELLISDEDLSSINIVPWLLFLNFFPKNEPQPTPAALLKVLKFVAENSDSYDFESPVKQVPDFPPEFLGDLAPNLLYTMSIRYQWLVRDWYKEIKDKSVLKDIDYLFGNQVVVQILKDLKSEVEQFETDEVSISVNFKQREIKATRELEDGFNVEILLTLPEQYPAKPVNVEIKNLAGVSEAKKRSWILEARQGCQSKGLIRALHGLLTHLDNFLNGVEPCAICYMLVDEKNKLPNKECNQCHNVYHADCIFKWFETNRDKLCPMCRGSM